MRILAVNRFYRPDHSATSQLLGDLAEHFATLGHDVTVIASRLRYEGGAPLPKRETIAGVNVRRMATTRFGRANLVGRAFDYLSFYVSSFFGILAAGKRGDLLIIKTDPPLITIPATFAARLKGMKTVNWCQDLFPEVAAGLGMKWADGWIGRVLKRLRNRAMRRAEFNAVLHDKMAELLVSEGVALESLRVLPNWADGDIHPVEQGSNPLRKEWGLEGKFVIGYSGNLGRAHMPEKVAELVRATLHIEGLVWLFIGGGAGIDIVRRAAAGAENVLFKPYQPRERLSESLSVADLHLISLDPACEGSIVPSKVYGVRAVGRPVLFLGDADGATARDVVSCEAGWVLDPRTSDAWVAAVTPIVFNGRRAGGNGNPPALSSDWSEQSALERWTHKVGEHEAAEARNAFDDNRAREVVVTT